MEFRITGYYELQLLCRAENYGGAVKCMRYHAQQKDIVQIQNN